jgi:hypothetical protein
MRTCEGVCGSVGYANTAIACDLYHHVLPFMGEHADAVANLITGEHNPDAESAAINRLLRGLARPCDAGGHAKLGTAVQWGVGGGT